MKHEWMILQHLINIVILATLVLLFYHQATLRSENKAMRAILARHDTVIGNLLYGHARPMP
jgi:hypothetical protein